jgi:hypothetical protein
MKGCFSGHIKQPIIDENPFCKVKTQKSSVKVNEFVPREVVDKLMKSRTAVPRRSQHGDGLEECQPTQRDDATVAPRRRLGVATIVPLDAGQ